jgi:hypothetical protein
VTDRCIFVFVAEWESISCSCYGGEFTEHSWKLSFNVHASYDLSVASGDRVSIGTPKVSVNCYSLNPAHTSNSTYSNHWWECCRSSRASHSFSRALHSNCLDIHKCASHCRSTSCRVNMSHIENARLIEGAHILVEAATAIHHESRLCNSMIRCCAMLNMQEGTA